MNWHYIIDITKSHKAFSKQALPVPGKGYYYYASFWGINSPVRTDRLIDLCYFFRWCCEGVWQSDEEANIYHKMCERDHIWRKLYSYIIKQVFLFNYSQDLCLFI